jgi:hypothetical protein
MISYDADQSGTEAEDEEPMADMGRRGRSHRSKNLGPDIVVDEPSPRIPIGSLSATRSDDIRQSRSRGRRESPIGRGRDRGRDRTVRG